MFDSDVTTPEHFLFGTVVVTAIDHESGEPVEGISIAIADDLDTACKQG